MSAQRFRAYGVDGLVAAHGDLTAKGIAAFDVGDTEIEKVVFYEGPLESESVFGVCTISGSGKLSVDVANKDIDPD